MSKLSQLHAELSEQAAELGFESLAEAEQAGYDVDWETRKLVSPEEMAHRAWLEEREQIVKELQEVVDYLTGKDYPALPKRIAEARVRRAIDFIMEGER